MLRKVTSTISSPQIRGFMTSTIRFAELDPFAKKPPKPIEEMAYEDPHFGKQAVSGIKLPDSLGDAVGSERYEQLMNFYGFRDPFNLGDRKLRASATHDDPNLVPTDQPSRQITCLCIPEDMSIPYYTTIPKDFTMRCQCGHFFRGVSFKEYRERETSRVSKVLDSMKGKPEYENYIKELKARYDKYNSLEAQCYDIEDEKSPEALALLDKMYYENEAINKLKHEFAEKHLYN